MEKTATSKAEANLDNKVNAEANLNDTDQIDDPDKFQFNNTSGKEYDTKINDLKRMKIGIQKLPINDNRTPTNKDARDKDESSIMALPMQDPNLQESL